MTIATDLDQLSIDTIRTLSIDAVQKANSGHPGAPMGAAPMAYVLWTRFLRHAPTHPDWPDRDRFVLSAGHASMLLYSLLHLTGYAVSLEDLESFRQWGSITPGHPEWGLTPGVEATTGPLGQGFANAVGMAIAERRLAHEFDRPGHAIVDHRTYVIASDGDLQEGIASEAASLAGHLRLGKLIVLYDDNGIQLDGPTAMAFSEDVPLRFDAYGWHTQRVADGNDLAAIEAAIEAARADDRPSLIAVRTHIGFGSPHKQDSQKAHGSPLGPDEVRLTKEAYGWDPDRSFYVPDEAREHFRAAIATGEDLVADWEARFDAYRDADPDGGRGLPATRAAGGAARRLGRRPHDVRDGRRDRDAERQPGRDPGARPASARAVRRRRRPVRVEPDRRQGRAGLQRRRGRPEPPLRGPRARHGRHRQRHRLPRRVHPLLRDVPDVQRLHARERPAGVAVGAPRHLRLDPRFGRARRGRTDPPAGRALRRPPGHPQPVVRPAGGRERDRGRLGARGRAHRRARGARPDPPEAADPARHGHAGTGRRRPRRLRPARCVERRARADPDRHRLGAPARLRRRRALEGEGIPTRVVSLPCWERFEAQDAAYRDAVLPPDVRRRVSVEIGVSLGWERWVGDEGAIIGLDHFGASAPAGTIFEHFGFTADRVTDVARKVARDGLRGRIPTVDGGHFGGHPTIAAGEAGVARSGGSDPGHS